MIDRLNARSASEVIGVAILTVEERMRGWLAELTRERNQLCGRAQKDRHRAGQIATQKVVRAYHSGGGDSV